MRHNPTPRPSDFPLRVVAAGTGAGALARSVAEIDLVHPFATLWGVYLSAVLP